MAITDLVPIAETRELVRLPDRDTARMQLTRVEEFKRVVRELFVEGHDFGTIPGTGDKPTLLKPGAEKLIKLLGLSDQYTFLDKIEEWERGFFNYTIKCSLVSLETGVVVAEGIGNCNSWESKYRYRWAFGSEIKESDRAGLKTRQITLRRGGTATQYRIENDDVASQVNTILKMAKKRAQMDAALSAGRLSDVFTQDLEEIAENHKAARGEVVKEQPEADAAESPSKEESLQQSARRGEIMREFAPLWNQAISEGIKASPIVPKDSDEVAERKLEGLRALVTPAEGATTSTPEIPF